MKRYRVFQVDAFTRTPFAGNPAGVVLDADGLDRRQMQAIARELNNSETAFVHAPRATDHDVHVRFFTPTTEVPVCGHATVAAHYVRAREGLASGAATRQLTGAGVQAVQTERLGDGDLRVWIDQQRPSFGPALAPVEMTALLDALGLSGSDLGRGPIEPVSTGHAKIMVPLRDRDTLARVRPRLQALDELSRRIGCNGYHLFTLDRPDVGILAHGRMFAPAIGIAEDPVTGNANGPLGAYLVRHGLVPAAVRGQGLAAWMRQGEAMGRPGEVRVEVAVDADGTPARVRIGGHASIVFRSEIRL
ncbi:MAG TPA: hypothetical protein DDZ67_01270 [Xanthomonadaceae bacterium]|nr:hypothetical protein [Xanthomonadaceae bacterium]